MTRIMRIDEMVATHYPVVDLREVCDMVDVVSKKTVKINGREFYTIVFKEGDGTYGCYYHNIKDKGMYGFQSGYETKEQAKEDLSKLIELWK